MENTTVVPATLLITSSELSTFTNVIVAMCFIIIFIGSIGNSTVLFIFGRKWKDLRNCELFLLNLAIADLIGSVIVPLKFIIDLLEYQFPMGTFGCKFLSSICTMSITVSSFTIVAITIDRLVIIKMTFPKKLTRVTVIYINWGAWILGSASGLYCLFSDGVQLYDENGVFVCRDRSPARRRMIHFVVTCLFQVVIPLIVVAVCNVMLVRVIRSNASNSVLRHSSTENEKRERISKKAIKLVRTIVVAFFVCQLPVNIFFFTDVFHINRLSYVVTIRLYYILHVLQTASNCINPLVYCKLHHYFKKKTLLSICNWMSKVTGIHLTATSKRKTDLLRVIDEIEMITVSSPIRSRIPLVPKL